MHIVGFKNYLRLERSLSANSIEAYENDVLKLAQYCTQIHAVEVTPLQVDRQILIAFASFLHQMGLAPPSQARIISGIKAFYKYLLYEDVLQHDPTELLETPKLGRKLPDVLTLPEINTLFESFDLATTEGYRNRTMVEILYSSGLRVSELVELTLGNILAEIDFYALWAKGIKSVLCPWVAKRCITYTFI